MADPSGKEPASSGGIGETISQGIEQLQSVVTGLTGKTEGPHASKDQTQISDQSAGKASDIPEQHVSEFIRDKYKSKPGEWPDQKTD